MQRDNMILILFTIRYIVQYRLAFTIVVHDPQIRPQIRPTSDGGVP